MSRSKRLKKYCSGSVSESGSQSKSRGEKPRRYRIRLRPEWHLVKESDGTLKGSSRRAQGGRAREARSGTLGYECENR